MKRRMVSADLEHTHPVRVFIVDDSSAYRAVAERGRAGEIYNVCAGSETSIRSIRWVKSRLKPGAL